MTHFYKFLEVMVFICLSISVAASMIGYTVESVIKASRSIRRTIRGEEEQDDAQDEAGQ